MEAQKFNKHFELTQEQLDKAFEWLADHIGKCAHTSERMAGAFGTPFSWTFRTQGLGTNVEVACDCGEKLDITDSSNW